MMAMKRLVTGQAEGGETDEKNGGSKAGESQCDNNVRSGEGGDSEKLYALLWHMERMGNPT